MKALVNARIYDYESYIEKGFIRFDSEIAQVGDMADFPGAEEIIDCRGCLVIPGLVNGHTHIYSAFARGMNVPFNPKSFTDILNQLWWKLDKQLDRDAVYYSAMAYGLDCLSNGVTTLIDHHASGLCIKGSLEALNDAVSKQLGLRGIYCFETSDRFPLEACIEENLSFEKNISENTGAMFGLHASMSLSYESLKRVADQLNGRPIHIHVAESMDDVQDCYRKYNKSIVERLDSMGLLNGHSILAHCVHINKQEAALIGKRNCYVALNPTSNMNNAVGLPDYELLRRSGIKCMVGNDGLGANITRDYLNLMFAMKNRLGSTSRFTLDDLREVICNGYELASTILNIKLGKLKAGYKADFLIVPYDPPTPISGENVLGHLIFGVFDGFKPKAAWVSGRQLLKDYLPVVEIGDAMEEARKEAEKVWKRLCIDKGESVWI